MSTGTRIEWTDHTFNPWWGCTKVHAGCKNCYAEALDRRWGGDHWGPKGPRRMVLGEWSKPAKWNAAAKAAGRVDRVFCASMCDLFEDYDGPVVDQQGRPVPMRDSVDNWTVPGLRRRVFDLIDDTPHLLWLLLTKRPENVLEMVPPAWLRRWPSNVMTGTSPCDQKTADTCIPALLKVPGRRFLSCEPLVGPVDLDRNGVRDGAAVRHDRPESSWLRNIHWVIVGGESGNGARMFNIEWARSIRDQCRAAGVPVFIKQLGANPALPRQSEAARNWPTGTTCAPRAGPGDHWAELVVLLNDPKGGDWSEWPEDLRVREFPGACR